MKEYIGLYVNGTLIWKCVNWVEFLKVEEEQRDYHRGEEIVVTSAFID